MKKIILTAAILTTIVAASFKPSEVPPRLYPELEAYFKTIEAGQYQREQTESLENIRYNLISTDADDSTWNCVFYCTENSFRSQASQVFLETLCYAKKHKNVKIFSAGVHAGEIHPGLIAYLSKIGYKVSKTEKEDKIAYEIKYSDKAKPIILFSKSTVDKSLPLRQVIPVVVCDRLTETVCKDIKTGKRPFELPFPDAGPANNNERNETILKGIAVAMQYVTERKL